MRPWYSREPQHISFDISRSVGPSFWQRSSLECSSRSLFRVNSSYNGSDRLSAPLNPLENLPPTEPAAPPPAPFRKPPVEDPPFTGWDILILIGATLGSMFVVGIAVVVIAHVIIFRSTPLPDLARNTELILASQLLSYFVVFAVMFAVVETRVGGFWKPLRWNWPRTWGLFLLGGAILYFVLIAFAQLLPIPKHLPIDRFFSNAQEAAIMSIFAVTVAPLMEELFFRGFLYPVLARRFGMGTSIFFTSAAFAALHGAQLKYSWAVLIIFLVGVGLTTVRALTKSVAASFLLHVGYNGTLSLIMFIATRGFRHLEKLNQ